VLSLLTGNVCICMLLHTVLHWLITVSIPKAAEEAAIEPTTKSRAGQIAPRVTHKVEQNATTKLYSIHMSSKPVGVVHKTGDIHILMYYAV
jgi:hypothetical protein